MDSFGSMCQFYNITYIMRIYYGAFHRIIDVTSICLSTLRKHDIITIPWGDYERAKHFADPFYGVSKKVFIEHENKVSEYHEGIQIKINMLTHQITTILEDDIKNKINHIHSTFQLKHGTFQDEIPEQKMSLLYLTGKETVLEIGGNVGRNSIVISSLVGNKLVTLESDSHIAQQLIENRDANHLDFHVECAALSKRKLIQQGWNTIPSDILLPNFQWVNTITYDQLKAKYNMTFDTLVLDCEGAFFYILMDMPEILENINLIIMENDYYHISHKEYVNDVLTKKNFYVDYTQGGGWGPCEHNFFEVWKR